MKISSFLLAAVVLVFLASPTMGGEWHSIVPLRSTRSDVLRLLGQPNSKYGRYLIDGEEATIIYADGTCLSGWNVPRDTVRLISVTFRQRLRLPDLKINFDNYERAKDPFVTSHVYYTNREEGIRYEVFEGLNEKRVLQVYFEPTSKDERLLRCEKKRPIECSSLQVFGRAVIQPSGPQSSLIFVTPV